MSFVKGEGTRIRFWHDRWIGDNTLKDLYLELYVCSAVQDVCIFEVLWISKGGTMRVWDLRFYRAFEDWELAASYFLFQLIQTRIPRGDRSDTLCWRLKGNGKFDTLMILFCFVMRMWSKSFMSRCFFFVFKLCKV